MASVELVRVSNLTYEYPGTRALDDVSFVLTTGSVTALVGPNGAGKSTLMRCMAALDRPLDGHIEIDGIDVLEDPRACHRRIGYLSDFFGLYNSLSVRQSLTYAALSQGMSGTIAQAAVTTAAGRLALHDKLEARCSELSRGQRQRVAIGQAMIHSPSLLILDEPASGLDPEARSELAAVFTLLSRAGMTLIVSSHILAELDQYSTHMLVIRAGQIVENRDLNAASANTGRASVRVGFVDPPANLAGLLERVASSLVDTSVVHCADHQAVFMLPSGDIHRAHLLRGLVQAGLGVTGLESEKESVSDSYLRSVRTAVADGRRQD
jgi:ABC-2 type transport system ATP-binding protein